MNYVTLDYVDLALAASLLLINGAVSVALSLGLARSLAISAVRMVVQLLLIGLILDFLLATVSPLWTGLAVLVMLGFAGYEAMARQDRRLTGFWAYGCCGAGDGIRLDHPDFGRPLVPPAISVAAPGYGARKLHDRRGAGHSLHYRRADRWPNCR